MKKSGHTHLDTSLVKRWLYSKVGIDFNLIYSEFLTRIQPKYLDEYRDCIYWFVSKRELTEIDANGEVWGKHIHDGGVLIKLPNNTVSTFFVHPDTNLLCRISDYNKKES